MPVVGNTIEHVDAVPADVGGVQIRMRPSFTAEKTLVPRIAVKA